MTFLTNPLGFTPSEFRTYVESLKWTGWRPQFVVLHNTAEPNLAQWSHSGLGKVAGLKRVQNLNHYYKSDEGWHSGPHIFVAPDLIWVACDLTANGVHASCYNSVSIGVEMVGDYSTEPFDSGDGAKVRDNAIAALAALHKALRIPPESLRFHKECLRDHHNCPGPHVVKSDVIERVKAALATPIVAGGGASGGAGASGSFAAPEPKTPALADHIEAVKAAAAEVAAPLSYNDKAALIFKFWLAAGFSPAQAAGLLAQADAESSLDPKAVGDHKQAFGLHQWHGSRADTIKAGCGIDLTKLPPLEDQLRAALWELQNAEKDALAKIKEASTASAAGYAAARYWERPGSSAQWTKRGATAANWAAYFAGHPV